MSALPAAAQMPGASSTAVTAVITDRTFCGHCGKPDDGGGPAPSCRERCAGRLALEPPRYCAHCGRRMKVQITPTGWSAQCSRHEMLVR